MAGVWAAGSRSLLASALSEMLAEERDDIGVEGPMKIGAVEARRIGAGRGVGLHFLLCTCG